MRGGVTLDEFKILAQLHGYYMRAHVCWAYTDACLGIHIPINAQMPGNIKVHWQKFGLDSGCQSVVNDSLGASHAPYI